MKVENKAAAGTALSAPSKTSGAWAERRNRIRQELVDEALRQFQVKGFDAVTISDIVSNVGISLRSFFRYFDAKESLAFAWTRDSGEIVIAELLKHLPNMDLLSALRESFLVAAWHHEQDAERISNLIKLIFSNPSLHGRYQGEFLHWEREFVRLAQKTHKIPESQRFELHVQSAIAITAWMAALQEWARVHHKKPLRNYVIRAYSVAQNAQM